MTGPEALARVLAELADLAPILILVGAAVVYIAYQSGKARR